MVPGPLNDDLVLKCFLFLPERPYWFRLAQVCDRFWGLVSQHRSSVRFPGHLESESKGRKGAFASIDPQVLSCVLCQSPWSPWLISCLMQTVANFLGRSPMLQHLDFSDSTVWPCHFSRLVLRTADLEKRTCSGGAMPSSVDPQYV